MPFPLLIPLALSAASAIGGALSNRKSARTSTQDSTTTPTITPEYKTLGDLLRTRAEERLRSTIDMKGYEANGIGNINDAFSGIGQTINNNLTSRGLGTSPVAGAVDANTQMARGGNIAQFLNTLPQLQRQMQGEDMSMAGDVLSSFGRGSAFSGKSVGAGDPWGGGFSSAAEMMAYLNGKGLLGGGSKPQVLSH